MTTVYDFTAKTIEGKDQPLSAWRGFLGARPFSAIQCALAEIGLPALDFCL